MRSPALMTAVVSACVVLAGCAASVEDTPVVRIVGAAKPSVSVPPEQVLPTADDLATIFGAGGFMGQLVTGGADMLLQGVGESEATPVDCVSPAYRLQKVVYQASPVRSVASRSWAGGSLDAPPVSGFFGVVQFATPDDAQAFFAAAADKWRRCNGQTLVLHQPEHGADGVSKVTEVFVENRTVSAVVLNSAGETIQRALGVISDCVVDVEITAPSGGVGARDAAGVANVMMTKLG